MAEMNIRKIIGVGAAFAATIPWLWKSHFMIVMLARNGITTNIGIGVEIGGAVVFDAVSALVALVLFYLSKLLLKEWYRPALFFFAAVIAITIIQDVTLHLLTENMKECNSINCDWIGQPEPLEPEVKTLK
jgi:glucan phosphoethanolaminetransferase (alkaline phosphatase superfamily)